MSAREDGKKPQTLLFSATVPSWVRNIANKYLEASNLEEVDLVGEAGNQTSTTVDHLAVRCVPAARAGVRAFRLYVLREHIGTTFGSSICC